MRVEAELKELKKEVAELRAFLNRDKETLDKIAKLEERNRHIIGLILGQDKTPERELLRGEFASNQHKIKALKKQT